MDTLNSVRSNIQDDIGDANDIIQAAVNAINVRFAPVMSGGVAHRICRK